MKEYRYKNVKELIAEYGKGYEKELIMDEDQIGKPLSLLQNAKINCLGYSKSGPKAFAIRLITGIDPREITEIPPLSCDVEHVYFTPEKKSVTVVLRDGRTGKSVCAPEDVYDPYVGFSVAYTRAVAGTKNKLREYVDLRYNRQIKKNEKASKAEETSPKTKK